MARSQALSKQGQAEGQTTGARQPASAEPAAEAGVAAGPSWSGGPCAADYEHYARVREQVQALAARKESPHAHACSLSLPSWRLGQDCPPAHALLTRAFVLLGTLWGCWRLAVDREALLQQLAQWQRLWRPAASSPGSALRPGAAAACACRGSKWSRRRGPSRLVSAL